jgi:hypothetical protein
LVGFVPARFAVDPAGAFSTLITCMFLHGGWAHFIGNMWMLYLFGDNVEERMGAVRYLIFYFLCGIGAGLAHYFMNPTSELPSLGASGAIAGVLGAYFRLFPTARVITLVLLVFLPLFIEIPAVVLIGLLLISSMPPVWPGGRTLAASWPAWCWCSCSRGRIRNVYLITPTNIGLGKGATSNEFDWRYFLDLHHVLDDATVAPAEDVGECTMAVDASH